MRSSEFPDGLPASQLDPRHARELRRANLLLERTVQLAIAARHSMSIHIIVMRMSNPNSHYTLNGSLIYVYYT